MSLCHMACDLASSEDMCAVVHAHPRMVDEKLHVDAFCKCWLPEATFKESQNAAYTRWVETGELVITGGNTTHYKDIETYLLETFFKYDVRSISFDPMQATYLITRLTEATGQPDLILSIGQSAKNMTTGMNLLQELVADGRLKTNSSLLIWCLKNLRARIVGSSMIQPVRPRTRSLKIDAAVALVMSLTRIAATPTDDYAFTGRTITL
jgi:phage terminase large subunit-like protein